LDLTEKVTEGWRKMHKYHHNLYFIKYYQGYQSRRLRCVRHIPYMEEMRNSYKI